MSSLLRDMFLTACKRLRQYGRVSIGRITGTTLDTDGKYKGMLALEEARLMVRAEVNAITSILIKKGVVTEQELLQAMTDEAIALEGQLQQMWPEIEVAEDGGSYTIKDVQKLQERSKRERWPP